MTRLNPVSENGACTVPSYVSIEDGPRYWKPTKTCQPNYESAVEMLIDFIGSVSLGFAADAIVDATGDSQSSKKLCSSRSTELEDTHPLSSPHCDLEQV